MHNARRHLTGALFDSAHARFYHGADALPGETAALVHRRKRVQTDSAIDAACGALVHFNASHLGGDVSPFRRREAENAPEHDESDRRFPNSSEDGFMIQLGKGVSVTLQRLVAFLKRRIVDETF